MLKSVLTRASVSEIVNQLKNANNVDTEMLRISQTLGYSNNGQLRVAIRRYFGVRYYEELIRSAMAQDRMSRAARVAWADCARVRRWTFFMLNSFWLNHDVITAELELGRWAESIRAECLGWAGICGLHLDTGRIHAHALVHDPSYAGAPLNALRTAAAQKWYGRRWEFGRLWLRPYSPGGHSVDRGAPLYVGKDVGTMQQFGTAPLYRPRRRR